MTPLHPAPTLPNPLPNFDRRLLHTVERIVPPAERSEWSRTWHAELWHMHHRAGMRRARSRAQNLAVISDLSIGLTRDALWLRTESWRRALSGTPTLCLASLAALCLLSLVLDLALTGSWHTLRPHLAAELRRCFFAAPLVLFVTFATASRRHIERNPIERGRTKRSHASRHIYRLKRQLFSIAKTALVLLLSFQLGADICEPFHALFPNTADVVQIFLFVIIALIGLRWAARDREQRCEQCLHAPASAAPPTTCSSGTAPSKPANTVTAFSASPRWKAVGAAPANGSIPEKRSRGSTHLAAHPPPPPPKGSSSARRVYPPF
jgi:hypothetical protein